MGIIKIYLSNKERKKMKYILLVISFIFNSIAIAGNHSNDYKYPKKDCDKMYIAIAQLLEEADKEWAHLEDNPEGSPDALEHAAKIQWYIGLAADYTTIYEAFCDKD